MDRETLVFCAIAVRRMAPVPESFLSALIHLVPGPVCRHFAFELSEIEENIAQQPTHRILRVKALSHGHKLDAIPVKEVHQQVEILDGSSQAINLVR